MREGLRLWSQDALECPVTIVATMSVEATILANPAAISPAGWKRIVPTTTRIRTLTNA